jgi:uncharacterized protein YceK
MPRLRLLATTLSLSLVIAVSGCASIEQLFAGPSTGEPLIGTSWSGTDSDGDEWGIVFQEDGTLGLTFGEAEYDDPTDTWVVAEETLTISIAFTTGEATMVGPYTDGATSIDLEGEQGEATWTLTIEQD